jgi:hypothetical protein
MQKDIPKVCADSLRTFSKDKYKVKLRASHAHELVAAYMGYKSKIALVADKRYPVSNLYLCKIVVMMQDAFIDQRRQNLSELPSELPDSYTMGDAVYSILFDDKWWSSNYPPFRNFEKMAIYLAKNDPAYQAVFKPNFNLPSHHVVETKNNEDHVFITVTHANQASDGKLIGSGQTTINLPRVAGRIGFGNPRMSVEQWTAGARRMLGSLGVQG